MKRLVFMVTGVFLLGLFLGLSTTWAQSAQAGRPPIAQPMVNEGAFALKLVNSLAVGAMTDDEIEAESRLGEIGITPRNDWIADYPVTPDIPGEIQKAVTNAADAKKLPIGRDEALKRFQDVAAEFNLAIKPSAGDVYETNPSHREDYNPWKHVGYGSAETLPP